MINPSQIPQFTGDLAQLEKDYGDLAKDAKNVRDAGADVHSQFQGLSAYYQAPEAEQLFATTKPVQDKADAFADDLETVSGALSSYATEIRPLVAKLKELKTKAQTFVDSVKDDDEWEYDEDKVGEHNQLRDDITATVAAFWAAERTCHNKITALWGGTQMVAGDGSDRKDQYGFSAEDMKNAKLPWGDPVEEKHHWYEVGHWVKSFVWDGLIVDGIWGTIKGLGTLVGFGGWEAMGQAWKGLAQLATGLALSSIPGVGTLFWALPDDKLPSWIRDSRTAMKETGKALVAWDQWGKNPARAAGAVTFNVLTTVFTGGAGAAASGAGKAGAVARVLGTTAKVIDPMTYIVKGAGAGLSKIGDISAALKGVGNIDIPTLPDNAITLPEGTVRLPDGTVNLPEGATIPAGATQLPDGSIKLPDDAPVLPEGTVRLPTEDGAPARYYDPQGNILDEGGNVIQKADDGPGDISDQPDTGTPPAGADVPRVDSPLREPAMAGALTDNVGLRGNDVVGGAGHSADNLLDGGGNAGHAKSDHGGPNGSAGDTANDGAAPSHSSSDASGGGPSEPSGSAADETGHADDAMDGSDTPTQTSATDETPPKSPGDDEPLLIRQDDDFSATHNKFGLRKSRFDPDLGIVPANPEGKITPLEHVLGGANPKAKEASQFTSFAPKDGTGKVYGDQEVSIDYQRLQADIAAGKVNNVEIWRPEQIQRSINDEINKVAGKDVEVPTTLKPSEPDAVTRFVNDLGLSKSKSSKVHRRVMALLNTRRDGEWLISGVIPKEYVNGPYPTTRTP